VICNSAAAPELEDLSERQDEVERALLCVRTGRVQKGYSTTKTAWQKHGVMHTKWQIVLMPLAFWAGMTLDSLRIYPSEHFLQTAVSNLSMMPETIDTETLTLVCEEIYHGGWDFD